ncbi:hypothetical protein ACGFR8_07700 [Streptomyces brevispora]|uniref:hypothetical protein n=1 Tax=Streptomyces brevispora TaxID=887462 RepID=UPI00371312CB
MDHLTTADEIREFLALCLNPGYGIKRAPAKLAKVMPVALRDRLETYVPQLADLREKAERLEAAADQARKAHADALEQWVKAPPHTRPAEPWRTCCDLGFQTRGRDHTDDRPTPTSTEQEHTHS